MMLPPSHPLAILSSESPALDQQLTPFSPPVSSPRGCPQATNERRPRHGVGVIIDCFNEMHLLMKQLKISQSTASLIGTAGVSSGDEDAGGMPDDQSSHAALVSHRAAASKNSNRL